LATQPPKISKKGFAPISFFTEVIGELKKSYLAFKARSYSPYNNGSFFIHHNRNIFGSF
jgi:hypothetical protein